MSDLTIQVRTFALDRIELGRIGWQRDHLHLILMGKQPGLHLDRHSSLRLYLGTLAGKAVATSEVFFGGGVASVQSVGTLPVYRRQGIGAAMTLKALQEARRQGYRIGVLTASPMGINLYRRIGFQEYCTFSTYLWHPPSE